MNARTFARIAAAAAVAAAASAVQAASVNPLDPAAYSGKPAQVVESTGTVAAYIDSTNPLVPSFHQGRTGAAFVGTAAHADDIYRDSANPLNPSHRFN